MSKLLKVVFTLIMSAFFSGAFSQILFDASEIKGPVCVIRDSVTNAAYSMSPEQSKYNVLISDGFAEITLYQMFINPGVKVTSTVYVFPLPDNGSVSAMQMEYKNKLYKAKIMEKVQAQHIYDSVSALGLAAALLVQDRPNIFQQSLANIAPGDTAFVKIKLCMPLKYNDGVYECAIPTMIGERFQSSGTSYVPSSGKLWNPPEDRDGQSLQINVLLQTGFAIRNVVSPTHNIVTSEFSSIRTEFVNRNVISDTVKQNSSFATGIMLVNAATFPNRDFVLRFSRDTLAQDFTVASHYDYDYQKGFFAFTMFPSDADTEKSRPDLEIVLLIDISGSQSGWPLDKEKQISLDILSRLRATDKINVLAFSDNIYYAFTGNTAVYATEGNIATAKSFINSLQPMGGTQLLNGVKAALSTPLNSEMQRFYIFLTDGFITNETEILDVLRNNETKPTVFTFGAGNSLNRYFLETSATVGNGYATEVTQAEDAAALVAPAWQKIASPQIKNLSVTFSNATVSDLLVPKSAVLYQGDPFSIYGTYTAGGATVVTVKGYVDGNPVEFTKTVDFATVNTSNIMLPQIWARQKISQLSIDQGNTTAKKDSIVLISEKYQVLSSYTAFIAVNPEDITAGGSMSEEFHSTLAVENRMQDRLRTELICRAGIIELSLNAGEYITDFIIYDMAGREVYKVKVSAGMHMSKFTWNGSIWGGRTLLKGRYVIKFRTSNGRSIMRAITWMTR